MRRLHLVSVLIGFAATLTAPSIASAQPGDHPATQLFFGPTGRTLPQGEGYVKGVEVTAPFAQGGVTDRFSIGIGAPLMLLGQGVMFTPKLQIQRSEKHSTSIGTLHILAVGESFGIGYVAHTTELPTGAVHVAVLVPYSGRGDWGVRGLMIGAEHYVSPRVTFITENYQLWGLTVFSAGARLKGAHTTWDLGWILPISRYSTPGGPILNVGWKF